MPRGRCGLGVHRSRVSLIAHTPRQNAWIESFNSRLRDELLNLWQFDSLLEAQVLIEDHRIDYNMNRPHSAHGNLTPAEFINNWINRNQPKAA